MAAGAVACAGALRRPGIKSFHRVDEESRCDKLSSEPPGQGVGGVAALTSVRSEEASNGQYTSCGAWAPCGSGEAWRRMWGCR
ncbi:hypothetical protein NDU88_000114 [Pleurodeles waltl]|uniref:Uncharacterized protein n=1 Tax=Pleurodeles waltl TaxID=8319 RepID=A0AAV7TEI2_PLEWA|nr:hypothetical protein NDU88_000114 [Pleurodeles waltl]